MPNEIRTKEEERASMQQTSTCVKSLLRILRGMDGEKTVTIHQNGPDGIREYKMDKAGKIGCSDADEFVFRVKLRTALSTGGALVVRRVTDVLINGTPVKTVCAAALREGTWIASASKETEEIFCTDPNSGRKIPRETHVVFMDFPEYEIEKR